MGFDTNWTRKAKITINSTKVAGDLTDYPVFFKLEDLGSGHDFWSEVLSTGADIRITESDEETEIPVEVVEIDTTAKTGEVHFKVDGTLSSSSDTDFWLFYGNSGASLPAEDATYGRENVWKSTYAGVWHLSEGNNTTTNGYLDSTSNNNDGTGSSMDLTEGTGQMSSTAPNFDGTNDYINCGTSSELRPTGDLTLTVVASSDIWDTLQGIVSSGASSSNKGLSFFSHSGTNEVKYVIGDNTNDPWLYLVVPFAGNFVDGEWSNLAAVLDGTTGRAYLDGVEKDTETSIGPPAYLDTTPFYIGKHTAYEFNGLIDEVRLNAERESDDWLETFNNNLYNSDTFYTLAAGESNAAAAATFKPRAIIIN